QEASLLSGMTTVQPGRGARHDLLFGAGDRRTCTCSSASCISNRVIRGVGSQWRDSVGAFSEETPTIEGRDLGRICFRRLGTPRPFLTRQRRLAGMIGASGFHRLQPVERSTISDAVAVALSRETASIYGLL